MSSEDQANVHQSPTFVMVFESAQKSILRELVTGAIPFIIHSLRPNLQSKASQERHAYLTRD